MSNKVYDLLKNITQLILPALGTFYFSLADIWHLPFATEIVGTITALVTLFGVVLKIESVKYNKKIKEGEDK